MYVEQMMKFMTMNVTGDEILDKKKEPKLLFLCRLFNFFVNSVTTKVRIIFLHFKTLWSRLLVF